LRGGAASSNFTLKAIASDSESELIDPGVIVSDSPATPV